MGADGVRRQGVKPIGILESCYKDKFAVPRQAGLVKHSWACLKIEPEFQPEQSLQGLDGFSHAWLIWIFHQNSNQRFHAKVHPPRLGGKTIGVFATRSPHHPNPIGLSLVKIERVEPPYVYFSGIDCVDGTPILDLKPYLPYCESIPDASEGWTGGLKDLVKVRFSSDALVAIEQMQLQMSADASSSPPNVRAIIEETLALDPRPLVYRGYENEKSPYRDEHVFRLFDRDIFFRFESELECVVERVVKC